MASLLDLGNTIKNLFGGIGGEVNHLTAPIGQNINNTVHNLEGQAGRTLYSDFSMNQGRFNPIAQINAVRQMNPQQAQSFRNIVDTTVPSFNLSHFQGTNPIQNFGVGVLQDILNTPSNAVKGATKLPAARTFMQGAADTANVALAPLSLLGVGEVGNVAKGIGTQGLKQIVKQGAIRGLKEGAIYGGLQGAAGSQNATLPQFLLNTGVGAATGGITGGVTGGALAGSSKLIGLLAKQHGLNPQQATKVLSDFEQTHYRDAKTGKWIQRPKAQWVSQLGTTGWKNPMGAKEPKYNQTILDYLNMANNEKGSVMIPGKSNPQKQLLQELSTQTPEGLPQESLKSKQPLPATPVSNQSSLPNDTMKILQGAPVKEKTLVSRIKVSDKYPTEIKQMLQGTYVPKSNTETINLAKQAVRLDPKTAETRAMNPQNVTDQAIGAELFNHYMDQGNIAKANQIINATSGTNEGQMIQILSQYDKTTPQGAVKFATNAVKQYNAAHPNNPLNLTEDTIKGIYDQAKKIQGMPQGRDRNIASNDLMNTVNSLIPSSFTDKAVTLWKAGLLTSLRTHERNLLSNAIHGTAEVAKDIPASLADIAMSARTGKRSTNFTINGLATGAKQGLTSAKDIITKGYDPTEDITKYDVKKINWGNSALGKAAKAYTEAVFRPLTAADKPFYNAAYTRSLYDQAQTASINAGKNGGKAFIDNLVANPTPQMLQTATKDAEVATFHNQTGLSKVAQAIQGTKIAGLPVGQVVAPFTGVPSAVAGQMVAYSPIGLVKGITTAGRVIAQNVPDLQRQAAQEIGRGVMGTGLFGLGAYLASKGLITGQPKTPQEAAQWQLQGKPANSIMIDGKWRSIGSIGPESLIALAGAKANQELTGNDASLGNYAGSLGKDFMGQTFLQGMSAPLNAITDPARYGSSFVGNQANSVIPNIVKDIAKSGDPYQRENNTLTDYLTNSIPGLRNQNLIKRDALGNPMTQNPTGGGAFADLFNSTSPISNPVVNELGRLNDTGNNATPAQPTKSQTINGTKMMLTPDQLNSLKAQYGPQVTQALQELIQNPDYQNLSDPEKANAINSVVSSVRKQVRGITNLGNSGSSLSSSAPISGSGGINGTYTIVDPATGNVKKIDLSQQIQQPSLTGISALDKIAVSRYNSAISTRANDIYQLYQLGKITKEQAGSALQSLSSQKVHAPKKPKKIRIKIAKFKTPKITFKSKKTSTPKLKLPKTPTLKMLSKSKSKMYKFV